MMNVCMSLDHRVIDGRWRAASWRSQEASRSDGPLRDRYSGFGRRPNPSRLGFAQRHVRVWVQAVGILSLLAVFGVGATAAAAAVDDEPSGLIASSATLAHVRALYDRAHTHEHTRAATVIEDWRLFQDGTVGSYRVNRLGKGRPRDDDARPARLSARSARRRALGAKPQRDRLHVPGRARAARRGQRTRLPRPERRSRRQLVGRVARAQRVRRRGQTRRPAARMAFRRQRTGYVARREYVERRRRYATSYDDYKLSRACPNHSRTRTVDSLGNEREQDPGDPLARHDARSAGCRHSGPRRVVEFPENSRRCGLPCGSSTGSRSYA